jgi:hypothetical protein
MYYFRLACRCPWCGAWGHYEGCEECNSEEVFSHCLNSKGETYSVHL